MRVVWGMVAGLLLLGVAATGADPFAATGNVSGAAVLSFSGSNVSAQFAGEIELAGALAIGARTVSFRAKGSIHGSGRGDTGTLSGQAWGTFSAEGTTDLGKPIVLSGGVSFSSSGITAAHGASGSASGTFCLVAAVEGSRVEFQGRALASGGGEFVTPDDPYTMKVAGGGTIELEAGPVLPSELPSTLPPAWQGLPWDPRAWPSDLEGELLRLLGRAEAP
jgi:hypothetical protein